MISADVILHPAIDVIEDLYVINQGSTLWHYRDPDQINVRWQNVLERPTDASEAEMIAGAEAETRIVSPLRVAQAIEARTMHDDSLLGLGTVADLLRVNPTAAYAGVREGQWSIAQTVDASHAEGATGDYALTILELNGYGAALHSVEIKYAGHTAEEQATIRVLGMERISGTDYRYRELIATSPEFTMATGAGVQTRVISFTPSPVLLMADYEYYAFVVNMEGVGQDPRLTYNSADPETEIPDLNIWEHRASLQPNVTPLAIGNNLYGAADPVSLSIDYTLLWPVSGVRVADPTVVSDGVVDHIEETTAAA